MFFVLSFSFFSYKNRRTEGWNKFYPEERAGSIGRGKYWENGVGGETVQ
jgi:hypothetical protein